MRRPPPDVRTAPRAVLIVKPSALGDVVTAMPVLRALRRQFPEARISWLLNEEYAPLLAHDSDLTEIIPFRRRRLGAAWRSPGAAWELLALRRELRRRRFDWVVDLQGLFRSGWLSAVTRARIRAGFGDAREMASYMYTHRCIVASEHTVDRNIEVAQQLGLAASGADLTLQVAPAGRAFAAGFLGRAGLRPRGFLIAVPPTRWATKRYPVRHWRAAARLLAAQAPLVVMGGSGDRDLCAAVAEGLPGVIDAAGRTGVAEMVALIAEAAGVICCDSAAKFIAPAVGTDAVTLVGPTRLERTGPYLRGTALVAPTACQGCLRKRCRHIACMELIDPAAVAAAGLAMLEKRGQEPISLGAARADGVAGTEKGS